MGAVKLMLVVIVVSGLIYACEQSSRQGPLAPEPSEHGILARHDYVASFEAHLLPVDQVASGPTGRAVFARSFINDRLSNVVVKNFPEDGEFPVLMCGSEGELFISVSEGYGRLSLWTRRGQFVPECEENDVVQVSTPAGKPILSGRFYSNCGTRCHSL